MKPQIKKWTEIENKKKMVKEMGKEIKKHAEEDENFKKIQRKRGIDLKTNSSWVDDKRNWSRKLEIPDDHYLETSTEFEDYNEINSKNDLGVDISRIIRLTKENYNKKAVRESIKKFNITLDNNLSEMFPTNLELPYNINTSNTKSDITNSINNILNYNNNGFNTNDIEVREKLNDLAKLLKENKDF